MEARSAYGAFERKWKELEGVVKSLNEAGAELLTFFKYPETQWKSLRSTNVIERVNLEFRRRVKTQGALPDENAVLIILFGLYATGQIQMLRINGFKDLPAESSEKVLTNA
jgi:transposase-like protein